MPSQEEIYQKVSATLVEALNVEEEEISPNSTLQGDLGASHLQAGRAIEDSHPMCPVQRKAVPSP